jgi:hypothetical protein
MKTNISKAQIEVWEWKEKAFRELEKVPVDERIEYISKKTQNTIERIKKRKRALV